MEGGASCTRSSTRERSRGASLILLGSDTTVHVAHGELAYSLGLTEVAPPLPSRPGLERAALAGLAVSFVAHLALMSMLWLAPPRGALNPLELADPPRAELLVDDSASWVIGPRPGREAARHALEQGATGSAESAPDDAGRYAVAGQPDEPAPSLARRAPRRPPVTPVDLLGATLAAFRAPASPYASGRPRGHEPTTAPASSYLGAMLGDDLGPAQGALGLGMIGTGRGAGGTGLGTVGLAHAGSMGSAGACSGPGCTGYGSGYGRGRGDLNARRDGPVPLHREEEAPTSSGLARDVIRRVVQEHHAEVRYCYEQGLVRNPSLEGRFEHGAPKRGRARPGGALSAPQGWARPC